jgi:hypothetical protein
VISEIRKFSQIYNIKKIIQNSPNFFGDENTTKSFLQKEKNTLIEDLID